MTTDNDLHAAHDLYCTLTGQKLALRFDRQRLWYELFQAGFTAEDLQTVVKYLQKEIQDGRRNVGALKLSNLLQPDRFEEDLNISRVKLRSQPAAQARQSLPVPSAAEAADVERLRQAAIAGFPILRERLSRPVPIQ